MSCLLHSHRCCRTAEIHQHQVHRQAVFPTSEGKDLETSTFIVAV